MSSPGAAIPAAAGDIAVALSPDPINPGGSLVDYALAPSGDIGLVTDMARIQQDVILRFYIPVGTSPFFPTLGDPIFSQIGRPFQDPNELTDAIANMEEQLLAEHAQDAANGQRTSSATLKSMDSEPPQINGPVANLQVTITAENDMQSLITAGVQ